MASMLKSVTHTPSPPVEAEAAAGGGARSVTTRPPKPLQDITTYSKRRLVFGKRDRSLADADGALSAEAVIGLDERTRIVATDTSPWKYICALDIDAPFGRFIGTAWVVAPRTLITAGHCVFDQVQMGGWAREIYVTPGRDREIMPFGTVRVSRFSTVDRWLEHQDKDFDMAALHLDAPLFGEGEGFQVGAFPDAELRDFMINVSGYPGTPGNGQEQWWAKNRIRALTARRIFYDVDTSGGQSGGPAYIFRDETSPPVVVGIHAYGTGGTPASIPMPVNSAPRIIPEVVEQIQGWIDNGPGPTS